MKAAGEDGAVLTVVVMGVSGAGKSAVGGACAHRLGWAFAEGDDFHSAANKAKMHAGTPLTDDDRWPWLRSIAAWIGEREAAGEPSVVACSALRRAYRDLLRDGHPSVRFLELDAVDDVLQRRIVGRTAHFMPVTLLQSQLDTLEPLQPDEPGVRLSTSTATAEGAISLALAQIRSWLGVPATD